MFEPSNGATYAMLFLSEPSGRTSYRAADDTTASLRLKEGALACLVELAGSITTRANISLRYIQYASPAAVLYAQAGEQSAMSVDMGGSCDKTKSWVWRANHG